jgi:hypothetical protein
MKTNATQRSLKVLRENGWSAHVVEKFLPARGTMKFPRRIDAFNIGDILAMRPPMGDLPGAIALVQCFPNTGGSGFAQHKAKILAIPELYIWKKAGGRFFLQGWAKQGPRGAVKRWTMREEEL